MSPSNPPRARILIVGAGAMGLITGYMLDQAGAAVTYLVRPHRLAALGRPQILYSYDDAKLRTFTGYAWISDPAEIVSAAYDYVLITLDGEALHRSDGELLMRAIGDAVRGTETHVIIGTIGIGVKSMFVRISDLPEGQVSNGALAILAHPIEGFELPLHDPTDPDLLGKADLAYGHGNSYGFLIDDSAPFAAQRFAEIYSASGASQCAVVGALDLAMMSLPLFPIFAANELMGWPKARDFGADADLWDLTTRAVREIQGLDAHGDAGRKAASMTTGDSLIAMFTGWEAATLPLDLPAFNRFHHGTKVNSQDRRLLQDCVDVGASEGKAMTALRDLMARVEMHRSG